MENEKIPLLAHESAMARLTAIVRMLIIICAVETVLLLGSNVAWLMYESQYQNETTTTNEVTQELEADGGGNAEINGDVNIGKSKTNGKNNDNN
jgi:hypothetical protein